MTKESKQPEINIGLVGHVDHGKTTLLKSLSGKWADTHSEEQKRGITIKLGYATVDIYKTKSGFAASKTSKDDKIERTVSFVDAPGHESLMATMISGAAIMDGALLLVAANEECPQPQTKEHLMALSLIGIKNIIIIQNKIDLVSKEKALENYKSIKEFVKGSIAENAPIIPISAQHNINIHKVVEAIQEVVPTPERDTTKKPTFFIARSFDVNKPGTKINKILGGILGGSIKQGIFKVGDVIEISPGRHLSDKGKWVTVKTKITGLHAGKNHLQEAGPGGSLGILTELDPAIVKSDQLSGALMCKEGELPPLWNKIEVKPNLLKRLVGVKDSEEITPLAKGEPLMINVNSSTTSGIISDLKKGKILITLKRPICAEKGSTLALSRRVDARWRLIGTAEL